MKQGCSRVLLVDGQPIFRQGLRTLIQGHPEVVEVGEASSEAEALAQLQSGDYNAVVLDLQLAQESGIDFIARVSAQDQAIKVIVLSISKEPEDVMGSIRKGASACLPRGVSGSHLLQALTEVLDGRCYLHPEIAHVLFRQIREDRPLPPELPESEASHCEKEIVALLCQGKSPQEVGQLLHLPTSRIKVHMRNLYQKWGVNTRRKLILRARELNLHEPLELST